MANFFSFDTSKFVLMAKISKAHGIKGELMMTSFSGQLQNITRYKKLFVVPREGQRPIPYNVLRSRAANKGAIVQLEGIEDRNKAEEFCGLGVLIKKSDLPKLASDEYYLHEFEGLQVQTESGDNIGKVDSFFYNGVHDLLVVKNGNNEFLIPLIPEIIINRDKTCLTIAPPPGLLDINSTGGKKG